MAVISKFGLAAHSAEPACNCMSAEPENNEGESNLVRLEASGEYIQLHSSHTTATICTRQSNEYNMKKYARIEIEHISRQLTSSY